TTETEIGVGWACAAPAQPVTPAELTKEDADKIPPLNHPNAAATAAAPPDVVGVPTPAGKPGPGIAVAACPAPPAQVKGFNVSLYPVLDGQRAEWPVWNATLRSDGRIENLYGSWATFERGGDYRLRGVDVALKELTTAPE